MVLKTESMVLPVDFLHAYSTARLKVIKLITKLLGALNYRKHIADARAEVEAMQARIAELEQRLDDATDELMWCHMLFQCVALCALVILLFAWLKRRPSPSPAPLPTRRKFSITTDTWSLDGLPPTDMSHARSLAGQIIADAARGRADRIAATLSNLDSDQSAMLLCAADLANGHTALMQAAKHGHVDCCELLLARGASALVRSRQNQTAAELAASAGHTHVADVVRLGCPKAKRSLWPERWRAPALPVIRETPLALSDAVMPTTPVGKASDRQPPSQSPTSVLELSTRLTGAVAKLETKINQSLVTNIPSEPSSPGLEKIAEEAAQ